MPEKQLYSIILKSDNEKLSKAYEAYLDAKRALQDCLYEEGIIVEVKASGSN